MKKIAIIGTVGVPARYGGFETLAHQLVHHLSSSFKLKVYCSGKTYKKEERVKHYQGARMYYLPFKANGIQSTIYDFVSILHALFVADTLLILGVSGGLIIPFVRWFTNKRIIVNIDGLEWRRGKWNPLAKAFLHFSERVAVRWSHADITDNEAIKRYTSMHYETLSHLIEYGGDHVIPVEPKRSDSKQYPFIYHPYAFKVARIEPENNIHLVLEAFTGTRHILVIVGNWGRSAYGQKLKSTYEKHPNLHLLDPIYDQKALDLLRSNCLVYIHGHSAGGTNPSLVEAMSLSLPIIAFDCSYNRASTEDQAIYFEDVSGLKQVLENTALVDLMSMREVMKEIATRRYTWDVIANKYRNLIHLVEQQRRKRSLWSKFSQMDPEVLLTNGLAHLKSPTRYYEKL